MSLFSSSAILILTIFSNSQFKSIYSKQFAVPDDYRGSFQEKSLYNGLVTGYTGRGKKSESLICS